MSMRKLVSCEFNIDTACVELRYADGEALSLYTPEIEDSFDTTLPMRTEMDWLIYNAPLEYAQMALDGTLEQYLGEAAGMHGLEDLGCYRKIKGRDSRPFIFADGVVKRDTVSRILTNFKTLLSTGLFHATPTLLLLYK